MPPKTWRWSVSPPVTCSWPSVVTRSWTLLSRQQLLEEVGHHIFTVWYQGFFMLYVSSHCHIWSISCNLTVCFCSQVSFPTSTNPSLGRRASRRLHRRHGNQKFWGLGFDRTRSSHLFFFIINIIANEEWLLDFVLLYFPITRKKITENPLNGKKTLCMLL